MIVIGRTDGRGATGVLGHYRARDGSATARVGIDLDRPHVALVVGKRGSGKSHTLGVLAEELADADGVVPVVVDPMGAFGTLREPPVGARVVSPRVPAGDLTPRSWCRLLGLDAESPTGSLVWRAGATCEGLAEMRSFVADADVQESTRRAAANHLALAASWNVFDDSGLTARTIAEGPVVVDCAGVPRAPANAVVAALANTLYEARVSTAIDVLPWLLVDEAHAFTDGVAAAPLERLVTRGRQPGVSLVAATQRPAALPAVAVSQSDLLVTHRLTDRRDRKALSAAQPSYLDGSFVERMPTKPGQALVVDDATESVHVLQIRTRETPHGGRSPRATSR